MFLRPFGSKRQADYPAWEIILGSYQIISATSLQTKGAEVPGTSVPLIACERLLLHVERELEVDVIHQAREYHFATLRILLEGH